MNEERSDHGLEAELAQQLRNDMHSLLQEFSENAFEMEMSAERQEGAIMCVLVQTMICFANERELINTPEQYFAAGREHYRKASI